LKIKKNIFKIISLKNIQIIKNLSKISSKILLNFKEIDYTTCLNLNFSEIYSAYVWFSLF
jgi:hypothetical protein